ncbi:hypothetical protein Mia14_0910 [Candidatus Mancarchaeum acidiphilum]|uniref:Uncharacterized protein n=1 Tax=Candidatus Mancarchaeum acidiphilum TaxID=1920749 RepID=A0A218NP01_9ARCH|nr:hypothetical protein [Candidatus Mancarchaeum acidiphilum]ASI14185.1 hypothetical protein Mia14_0910 [Candidatus Mancarchaeum acidiphilum]
MQDKTKNVDKSKGLVFEVKPEYLKMLDTLLDKKSSKEIINLLKLVDYYNLNDEIKNLTASLIGIASHVNDNNMNDLEEYYNSSLNDFGKMIDSQVKKIGVGKPDFLKLNKQYVELNKKLNGILKGKSYMDPRKVDELLDPLNSLVDQMNLPKTAEYLKAFDKQMLEKLKNACTKDDKFFAVPFMLVLYHSSENKLYGISKLNYISGKLDEFAKNGLAGNEILDYLLHEIRSNYEDVLESGIIKENPFKDLSNESVALNLLFNYKFRLLSVNGEEPKTLESIEIDDYKYKKMERDNSDMYQ